MKRILFTSLQVAITLLLLWWIFRDPEKRARMAVALARRRLSLAHSRRA